MSTPALRCFMVPGDERGDAPDPANWRHPFFQHGAHLCAYRRHANTALGRHRFLSGASRQRACDFRFSLREPEQVAEQLGRWWTRSDREVAQKN